MQVVVQEAKTVGGGGEQGGRKSSSSNDRLKIASYRMSSLPRGLALIVEIEQFDNDVMDERFGSQVHVHGEQQRRQQHRQQ